MKIAKDRIVHLLLAQGKNEQADEASNELPDPVNTKNPQHAGLLSKYGIDIGGLGGMPSTSDNSCQNNPMTWSV
jgi:hypothetical protein